MMAVKQFGDALEFAHDDFKKDPQIVLMGLKYQIIKGSMCHILLHAHDDLKKNPEFKMAVDKIHRETV